MTTYNGTTGNDVFATPVVAGDTVDGKAGDDTITLVDLSSQSAAVAYDAVAAATSTGTAPIAGMLIKNVEHITTLNTGSGADTLTISQAQGVFTWFANGGIDRLVLNYAANTAGFDVSQSGSDYTISNGAVAHGIELLTITGGSGNDSFSGLAGGDIIDGGAGDDTASFVFTGSANIGYNAKSAATSTGLTLADGTVVKRVEHLGSLTTGSGADTLTITGAQGSFEWHAGSGTDTLVADYSTVTTDITAVLNGTYYYIDTFNSAAYSVEKVTITGGSGNDSLSGTPSKDTLNGGTGDDALDGLKGISLIDGGTGNDTVSLDYSDQSSAIYYSGIDAATATGTTLSDGSVIKNVEHLDSLITGSGSDIVTLKGDATGFTWHAGSGTDRLVVDYTGVSDDITTSGTGNPYFYLSEGNSYAYDVESVAVTGGSGDDSLGGTAGNDILNGGAGDDVLDGLAGISVFDGGAGIDTISCDLSANSFDISFDAVAGMTAAGVTMSDGTIVKNVEHLGTLSTGSGNDTLTLKGSTTGFVWYAGGGNDRLVIDYSGINDDITTSGTGAPYYYLSEGNSYAYAVESVAVTGGGGDDTLAGTAGNDILNGGDGNDALDGLGGVNQIDGGDGNDTVSLDMHLSHADIHFDAVAATQAAGITTADGSTIKNVEHIGELDTGSGNDTLTISAAQGNFTWYANAGNDRLIADYSAAISDVTAYQNGTDYYYIDVFNSYAYAVESVAITGGSGNDGLTGTTGNDWIEGNDGNDLIDGGDGNDTAAYTLASSGVHVTLVTSGQQDTVGAGLDTISHVENLTGSAFDDQLTGNASANVLDGGAGADTLTGGAGDDSYYVDNAGDTTVEAASAGKDTVFATLSWTAAANIDNITLLGATASLDATGNDLANVLTGNAGWNKLDGAAGADTMIGGLGNDTYYVDNAGDVVTELAAQGTDTVNSSVNYVMADNVENLILTGTALIGQGNDLNNTITGNTEANNLSGGLGLDVLNGGDGNDTLDGGAAADIMKGGLGNDSYYVDNSGDTVTEYSAQGTDTVYSAVNYTLTTNVENLYLSGTAVTGSGNTLANTITGNDLANMLSGGDGADILNGGIGADTMKGGNGADTYYVDNAHDVVTEFASDTSIDQVFSSVSYVMTDSVEKLTLSGIANLNGNGNSGANTITGNDGNNRLMGMDGNDTLLGGNGNDTLNGGTGADIMKGGNGDDIYTVDNSGDAITEYSTGGIDMINSSIGFMLGSYLENLTLTGTANINGSGNGLDNTMTGNSGNNGLFGSSGSDTLIGGDGNDSLDGGTGIDHMTGGLGDDNYTVDSIYDVITEAAGQGHDQVYAAISWTLGANFEDLDFSGGGNYSGTGNTLDNTITGNVGANVVNGMAGSDWIDGFYGNDTYIGGTGADTFNFSQGTGHDHDVINDFSLSDGDIIRVHDALSVGTNLIITQVGSDVKLDFGDGDYVMVLNATDNATFESHIAYL